MMPVLRALPAGQVPERALDTFESLLDEWRPIASRSAPFRWATEQPSERIQYLINALYLAGVAIEHEAEAGRARIRPHAADEFHVVLVHEVLDALAHGSHGDLQFVEQMRNVWDVARRD
jgi:hypothetical protein